MINKKLLVSLFLLSSISCQADQKNSPISNEQDDELLCHPHRIDKITQQLIEPTMVVNNISQKTTPEASRASWISARVSSHVLFGEDGTAYKGMGPNLEKIPCVDGKYILDKEYFAKRPWATGVGYWNEAKKEIHNINDHAISIVFVNGGSSNNKNPNTNLGDPANTDTWDDFTDKQVTAYINFMQQLKEIYDINNKDIVGYGEVRTDKDGALTVGVGPGPKFYKVSQAAAEKGIGFMNKADEKKLAQPCNPDVIRDFQLAANAWGPKIPVTGELNKQTIAYLAQFRNHHDPSHYNPNDSHEICRYFHMQNNLLEQYKEKKAAQQSHDHNEPE